MTGLEAVIRVWARDGRGEDESRVCVWGGHPGAGNYRPPSGLAWPAGAGTMHMAAAELGRGSGTVLAETTTYPPGPNPQGP